MYCRFFKGGHSNREQPIFCPRLVSPQALNASNIPIFQLSRSRGCAVSEQLNQNPLVVKVLICLPLSAKLIAKILLQHLPNPVNIFKGIIKWHGAHANHIRFAPIG